MHRFGAIEHAPLEFAALTGTVAQNYRFAKLLAEEALGSPKITSGYLLRTMVSVTDRPGPV